MLLPGGPKKGVVAGVEEFPPEFEIGLIPQVEMAQ